MNTDNLYDFVIKEAQEPSINDVDFGTPKYEVDVENYGITWPDYFQGCSGIGWDDVFIGAGETYNEAVKDALENALSCDYNITEELIEQDLFIPEEENEQLSVSGYMDDLFASEGIDPDTYEGETPWYYVCLRVRKSDSFYED